MSADAVPIEFDRCDRETDDAVCVRIDGRGVWLPKSQLEPGFLPTEGDGAGRTWVARWLAEEKGLV